MNPEKLKKLAELCGYKVRKTIATDAPIQECGGLWVVGIPNVFNPLKDASQLLEVIDLLHLYGYETGKNKSGSYVSWGNKPEYRIYKNTLPLAVMAAAKVYIDGLKAKE